MIAEYKTKSTYAFAASLVSAICLFSYDAVLGVQSWPTGYKMLSAIGSFSLIYAFWSLVRGKGRSVWWTLIIFPLSIFGMIILFCLRDLAKNTENINA